MSGDKHKEEKTAGEKAVKAGKIINGTAGGAVAFVKNAEKITPEAVGNMRRRN